MKSKLLLFMLIQLGAPLSRNSAVASDGLEYNTAASQAYESRSLLTNPAALGYQTDLNGLGFYYAHAHGFQSGLVDEHSTSLSIGYFGFALEALEKNQGKQTRYNFGFGVPLTPHWYVGARYRISHSSRPDFDGLQHFDIGLQARPDRRLSIGVLAKGLNQPQQSGVKQPIEYTLSATYRPIEGLDLSGDLFTPGDRFLQSLSGQLLGSWEFYRGAKLFAGFHTERKALVGLQINFGQISAFASGYYNDNAQGLVAGLQLAHVPYRSVWMPPTALKVEIDGKLGESPVRGGLLGKDKPSLWSVLDLLDRAALQPYVTKVFLRLDDFPLGLAAAQDVYDAIWNLRKHGKEVEVYLESTTLTEYLIASAANRIVLEPSAEIRFTGLRGQRYFFKGLFDKVGVEGEFFAKGEYKSAPESFTRKEGTALNRGETLRQLKIAETRIIELIGRGRKFTEREWNICQSQALIGAEKAKELGLIDEIAHFPEDFEKRTSQMAVRTELREQLDKLALPRRIAIVVARGDILKQEMRLLSVAGESQVTPDRVAKNLDAAISDPYTQAVVLRVSSPGGEVLASDEIAAAVKKTSDRKPVVVSMGDVAASGGYFIAAPAAKIYAQSLSITGSIGVFLGKFNFKKLYEKLELNKEVLTHAPYPGLMSEDKPWSEAEKKVMLRRLDEYYAGFVSFVAKHRKLELSAAENAAKGRVILGEEATALKIVDAVGGYRDSVKSAASLSGLVEGDYVTYVVQSQGAGLALFGDDSPLMTLPEPAARFVHDLSRYSLLGDQKYLYWSPYSILD